MNGKDQKEIRCALQDSDLRDCPKWALKHQRCLPGLPALSRSVVERWLTAFDDGTLNERGSSREKELERENERLKAKVGELTMQIDVLKKIDDWIRRERSVASSIITEDNLAQFQRPAKQPVSPSRRTTTKGRKKSP